MKTRLCPKCDRWFKVKWAVNFCAFCGTALEQTRKQVTFSIVLPENLKIRVIDVPGGIH